MKYVTDSYREGNLRKLADGLLKLPEDYKEFHMGDYFVPSDDEQDREPTTTCELLEEYKCGSVGCAIGHGPLLGIGVQEFDTLDGDYHNYGDDVFICRDYSTEAWDWCFSSDWEYVDNTPQGAAKRILWLLDEGLPDNGEDQMCGTEELCYV